MVRDLMKGRCAGAHSDNYGPTGISSVDDLGNCAVPGPNPEEIHDLPTQIRRFQAMTEALGVNCKRNERRLLRHLARIRKRAGEIRDLDVLTGYASTVQLDQEYDCLVQLLEYLGAERYRRAEQLHALVSKYGAEPWAQQERRSYSKHSSGRHGFRAQAATLDRKNLHAYRLKIKELRYVLEMADGPRNQEFIDRLGEIKDAIGEWHDWEELIAITVEVLDHKANLQTVERSESD
jgi:CHAD domain-containing protein